MTDESLSNTLNHPVSVSGPITLLHCTTFFVIYVPSDVVRLDYMEQSFSDCFEESDEGVCGGD